jgi:hypothetical protein
MAASCIASEVIPVHNQSIIITLLVHLPLHGILAVLQFCVTDATSDPAAHTSKSDVKSNLTQGKYDV